MLRFVSLAFVLSGLCACTGEPVTQNDQTRGEAGAGNEDPKTPDTPKESVNCDNPDQDGDGARAVACGGDDCDDNDPNRFVGNIEICDAQGRDEDCDPSTLGGDIDRDGFQDDRCCNLQPDDSLLCGLDCDDLRDSVKPGALDSCNGIDDNCDGAVDETPQLVFYKDADGDGYGVSGDPDDLTIDESIRPLRACERPNGYAIADGDCNDEASSAHPAASEVCDELGIDEDCDDEINEYGPGAHTPAINPITFYQDLDGDGYGTDANVVLGCEPPTGYVARPGDCREDRKNVHPGSEGDVVPDCPIFFSSGAAAAPVYAQYCTNHWECVIGSCGDLQDEPGYDAVWDYDCDQVVETEKIPVCGRTQDSTVCQQEGTQQPPISGCGLGTGYGEFGCLGNPNGDECERVLLSESRALICK